MYIDIYMHYMNDLDLGLKFWLATKVCVTLSLRNTRTRHLKNNLNNENTVVVYGTWGMKSYPDIGRLDNEPL